MNTGVYHTKEDKPKFGVAISTSNLRTCKQCGEQQPKEAVMLEGQYGYCNTPLRWCTSCVKKLLTIAEDMEKELK